GPLVDRGVVAQTRARHVDTQAVVVDDQLVVPGGEAAGARSAGELVERGGELPSALADARTRRGGGGLPRTAAVVAAFGPERDQRDALRRGIGLNSGGIG